MTTNEHQFLLFHHVGVVEFALLVNSQEEGAICWDLTEEVLDPLSFLIKYLHLDPVEDKYMAISLDYRGKIKSNEANETVRKVKKAAKFGFVECMPTGFKIGLNVDPSQRSEVIPWKTQKTPPS